MDESRRRQYLEAMGISVWVKRADPAMGVSRTAREEIVARGRASPSRPPEVIEPQANGDHEPPSWVVDEVDSAAEEPASAGRHEVHHGATGTQTDSIAAMEWEPLREAVRSCTTCGLHRTRTQAVFGVGNPNAEWMIIGEAPGAEEDRLGEPFVGRAGKLLDKMLMAIGLDRSKVFIANVLKCRPPQNRDPSREEAGACRPFLERQIALIGPRIIVSVGRVSAQNLLDCDTAVGRLRGRVHRFGRVGIPLVVTYHPAYLLRRPIEKRKVWDDLKLAMSAFGDRGA